MRVFLSALAFGTAMLASISASSATTSRLVYVRGEGAETCPEAMELRLAVLHRLGYNPFDPNAKQSILVQLRRDAERLRATIDLIDAEGRSRGSRYLDAPTNSCDELIGAAALSISLAIDRERALVPSESPKPTEKLKEPAALPTETPNHASMPNGAVETPAPARIARIRRTRRELTLSLHGSSQVLVAPTVGMDLGFGLRRDYWSLTLESRAELPVSRDIRTHRSVTTGSLTTWMLAATVVPCLRGTTLRFCGLLSAGVIGGSSSGVLRPDTDQATYAAVGLRLGTERRVSRRLRLGVHIDCLASLLTYSTKLGGSTVWESNRLASLFGLDAAWDIE